MVGWVSELTVTWSDLDGPGGKELEEVELDHLDGHKGSKWVTGVQFLSNGYSFQCLTGLSGELAPNRKVLD